MPSELNFLPSWIVSMIFFRQNTHSEESSSSELYWTSSFSIFMFKFRLENEYIERQWIPETNRFLRINFRTKRKRWIPCSVPFDVFFLGWMFHDGYGTQRRATKFHKIHRQSNYCLFVILYFCFNILCQEQKMNYTKFSFNNKTISDKVKWFRLEINCSRFDGEFGFAQTSEGERFTGAFTQSKHTKRVSLTLRTRTHQKNASRSVHCTRESKERKHVALK